MRLIAHRGFASVAPKNTLRAVDCATAGAVWIEADTLDLVASLHPHAIILSFPDSGLYCLYDQ